MGSQILLFLSGYIFLYSAGSGRVTGSPGQLLPGRVGLRVNLYGPVPALV